MRSHAIGASAVARRPASAIVATRRSRLCSSKYWITIE
jgi:hypothetical protein